jgi:hypothetical protein
VIGRVNLALLARVLVVLMAINVGLAFVKVNRLVRWLTPVSMPPAHDLADVVVVVRHVDGVLRRLPALPHGRCLIRSLTLYFFCTRLGYPVQISFGICRRRDGVEGHGWLVLHDQPFMEPGRPEKTFLPVWRLPSSPDSELTDEGDSFAPQAFIAR